MLRSGREGCRGEGCGEDGLTDLPPAQSEGLGGSYSSRGVCPDARRHCSQTTASCIPLTRPVSGTFLGATRLKGRLGWGQTAFLFPLHLVLVLAETRDVTFTPNSAQSPSGISTPYVCPPRPFLPGLGGSGAPREGIRRWVRVSREAKATLGTVSHCSLPPPPPVAPSFLLLKYTCALCVLLFNYIGGRSPNKTSRKTTFKVKSQKGTAWARPASVMGSSCFAGTGLDRVLLGFPQMHGFLGAHTGDSSLRAVKARRRNPST